MTALPSRDIDPELIDVDQDIDSSLRPRTFDEYIGQSILKEKLSIFVQAAKKRGDSLDHCLFHGPPGLGKTSLAHVIAHEMGVSIKTTSGPVIERAGDLAALLTNLEPNEILFIDEIHRLNRVVEETLYSAMEDYKLDVMIGQGPSAKTIRLDLPHFTLIGATTRAGLLSSPLRDRFGINLRLEFYTPSELSLILKRSAKILNIPMVSEGATELAARSRGTPRITNRLLKRVRDYAEVKGSGNIDLKTAREALNLLDIDPKGFDAMDRKILLTIIDKFSGGPVGADTLSSAIGEERETIEDVYEPYLTQEGYLQRTPRGRVATPLAYEHLGRIKAPESQELKA